MSSSKAELHQLAMQRHGLSVSGLFNLCALSALRWLRPLAALSKPRPSSYPRRCNAILLSANQSAPTAANVLRSVICPVHQISGLQGTEALNGRCGQAH